MAESETNTSVPLSWVLLFVLLVFVVGAAAVLFVGGTLL